MKPKRVFVHFSLSFSSPPLPLSRSLLLSLSLSLSVPIIKTEPNDDYEPQGAARLTMHSKAYYGQLGVTPAMPADPGHCLVGGYPSSSPSSSPKIHDRSPAAYPKCLSGGQSHHAIPGVPAIQEASSRQMGVHPGSPDHAPLVMLQPQVAPHLSSPGTGGCSHGYRPPALYPNGSPASSPASHPSTPGAGPETPFAPAYSPPQAPPTTSPHLTPVAARSSPPALLREESSPPTLAVTVKQEPQELDQMYLDDGESWELAHDCND